jgi:hypothetical protein
MSAPITAPIKATLELDATLWGELPAIPESIGIPTVQWGFVDEKIETDVVLTVDGRDEIVSFWITDQDGVCNTTEDNFDIENAKAWEDLEPEEFEAAIAWGKDVHRRICEGVESIVATAAPYESDAYNAVIAFATNAPVPDDERTPKEMALFRAGDALEVTSGITGSAQDDLQILMVDLLHFAEEVGLDVHLALQNANRIFQLEHNDPDFANGI